MSDFVKFRDAVKKNLEMMKTFTPFKVNVMPDSLWLMYLDSFPEGTNPVFRERTEHDCSCCRSFVKKVGNVVFIQNEKLVSIWDVGGVPEPYQTVADKMSQFVKSIPIDNIFLSTEPSVGNARNIEQLESGETLTWEHFHGKIPSPVYMNSSVDMNRKLSDIRAAHDVMIRGFETITEDALQTILDLILQNTLYRGAEFKQQVQDFLYMKEIYDKTPEEERNILTWSMVVNSSSAKFRNSSIGTLAVDLSDGRELEEAVSAYEAKVAPENYKRTTALVTPVMIKKAEQKCEELGIVDALPRRAATAADLTINNVLFADRSTQSAMSGSVFDDLAKEAPVNPDMFSRMQEIPVETFMQDVVPRAEKLEVLVDGRHKSQLMTLIAPVDAEAPNILKWNNNFSWTYAGDVTDAIKEKVRAAGGKVDGVLNFRLHWFNYDDLDAHALTPAGEHIHFSRMRGGVTGGVLDTDMNAGGRSSRDAVENIVWSDINKMVPGEYEFKVHNFQRRETRDPGFEAQIEFDGKIYTFNYSQPVKNEEYVKVATITLTKDGVFIIKPHLESSVKCEEVWGIHTHQFQQVSMLLNSPNYWDGQQVGNKHWFFILAGCLNPDDARGLYNEYLRGDLYQHRKVFEVLGGKLRVPFSDEQLSGVGFSSTRRDSVICRVTSVGSSQSRVLKIQF